VAGDAGADGEVGATIDEELSDFGVHGVEVGQGVKDWGLTADAVGVDVGAGVDLGAAVEEETGGVEEAVFGSDVEERCATKRQQAPAGLAAIELGVAAIEKVESASRRAASSSVRPRRMGTTPGRRSGCAHRRPGASQCRR
jgi:hypothetical protein